MHQQNLSLAENRSHLKMEDHMNTISLTLAPSSARKPVLNRLARAVLDYFETRRQRRQLAELPREMLDDIGVSEADLRRELKRSAWDAPVQFFNG